jgi:16S rRNA (guanine(966)-N(2))-methyltransferase RsmD
MRIISGLYKGRKIVSSDDHSIRPTTDRVKEYMFNILLDFPKGKTVIDMFSGSGNLGIESLSRGAKKVYFIEMALSSIAVLKTNLSALDIKPDQYEIIKADALQFSKNFSIEAHLCLLDPPFVYPPIQELLNNLFKNNILATNGLLVIEHEVSNPIEKNNSYYDMLRQKKMGRSLISILGNREDE